MPSKKAKATTEETVTVAPPISIEEVTVKNKDSLETIVVEELWKIESDLTVLGFDVPADNKVIDILCNDHNGQLVILMLSINEDDTMLFEGLQTLNEVNRVRPMLRYFNKDQKINDKEPARLILVAPSFSTNMLTIATGISNVRISLYAWEYLQFGESKALRVTPISLSEAFKNRK